MLKIFAVLVLAGFCSATHLDFPVGNVTKCILIDIEMMNSLTWTDSEGNSTKVPDWDFTNSSTINGNCGANNRQLSRQFSADKAVYSFTFTDTDKKVSLVMSLNFIPNNVFKNGEKKAVLLEAPSMELSMDDKAFMCSSKLEQTVSKTVEGNKYDMTVRLMTFHAQAYNVSNNKYSKDSHCEDDVTTEEPPTTKPAPKPTTEPPTTEPPTTEPPTTKPAPNTTTEPHTTEPTPKPATTPVPTSNHPAQSLSLMDSGRTCIVMKGQFLFTLPYMKTDGTKGMASVGLQDINPNLTMGSCDSTDTDMIQINFLENWWFNLTIKSDAKAGLLQADDTKYWWHTVNLTYVMDEKAFPGYNKTAGDVQTYSTQFDDGKVFEATVAGSYLCNSDTNTDLGNGFKLETWDLQYNAFQTGNKTSFNDDNVAECSDDAKTNSIVPIAVGAALAGLVVIVLIAYLIGRRRNRKGYESV